MTRGFSLIAIGALLALTATQSFAAGDPARGKTKVATCVACHGQDGNAVDPQYPRLAGSTATTSRRPCTNTRPVAARTPS